MFMVMMSGKYTCLKCQGALDATESLHVFCQSCDEHYMIAGTEALAEGSSLEELQDEQEDEDEITTEDGAQKFEDSDEDDDVKQNSKNVTATWKPDVTYRKNAINRVAEVDRIQSTFKHMALSQSKKRRSFEDAETIFESYHYPDGMYPIRTDLTKPLTMVNHHGDMEHYRLEKIDYDWTGSSRTKLNTSEGKLLSLMYTSSSNQLLKGFRRMSRDRRAEIYRLLNVKNAAEQQGGILWYVAHMKIIKSRTKSYGNGPPRVEVFCMEIIIERVGISSAFLFLQCLNGTFEAKKITLPFYPEVLPIGRQTNSRTAPTPENGYFDSKAVSRQHADIWAGLSGRVFIRDVKSSNGTYVNDLRLSPEKCESEPHELRLGDKLELGYNIESEDQKTVVHYKIFAIVDFVGFPGLRTS
ncbi:hypothetical protein LTR46_009851 [Exophiala xenobiotica]|nr:hypothetical protein LTR46_009851 [Exophiala xenobiotica]